MRLLRNRQTWLLYYTATNPDLLIFSSTPVHLTAQRSMRMGPSLLLPRLPFHRILEKLHTKINAVCMIWNGLRRPRSAITGSPRRRSGRGASRATGSANPFPAGEIPAVLVYIVAENLMVHLSVILQLTGRMASFETTHIENK